MATMLSLVYFDLMSLIIESIIFWEIAELPTFPELFEALSFWLLLVRDIYWVEAVFFDKLLELGRF